MARKAKWRQNKFIAVLDLTDTPKNTQHQCCETVRYLLCLAYDHYEEDEQYLTVSMTVCTRLVLVATRCDCHLDHDNMHWNSQ